MKNSFDMRLKGVCVAYCTNGKKGIPNSAGGYLVPNDSKAIIKDLLDLIFNTRYFHVDTQIFLSDHRKTYRTVANSAVGCAATVSASRSRIYTDIGKLKKSLGEDAMEIIFRHPDAASLERYGNIINELIQKQAGKGLVDGFCFKVVVGDEIVSELDIDTYCELVALAMYYNKNGVRAAQNSLTAEMIGYMAYLDMNKSILQGEELSRYEELKRYLIDASD